MKKLCYALMLLTSGTMFAEEYKNLKPVNQIVYVNLGSSFKSKEINNPTNNLIHFGLGQRLISEHAYDLNANFSFNHDYIKAIFQVNYLFSPEIFYGGYVGIGVKAWSQVRKNIHLRYIQNECLDPIYSSFPNDPPCTFDNSSGVPVLVHSWVHTIGAEVPLIVGYHNSFNKKVHFIELSVNKDLDIQINTGVGF
jgi:hypothetical protein